VQIFVCDFPLKNFKTSQNVTAAFYPQVFTQTLPAAFAR